MIEAVVLLLVAAVVAAVGGGLVVFGAWMYHKFIRPEVPGLEDIENIIIETITRKFEEVDEEIAEAMDNDEGESDDGV